MIHAHMFDTAEFEEALTAAGVPKDAAKAHRTQIALVVERMGNSFVTLDKQEAVETRILAAIETLSANVKAQGVEQAAAIKVAVAEQTATYETHLRQHSSKYEQLLRDQSNRYLLIVTSLIGVATAIMKFT